MLDVGRTALIALLAFCAPARAEVLEQTIPLSSRTLSDREFLAGRDDAAPPVMLTGALSIPESRERLPAIILLHGSDGPGSGAAWGWERVLNAAGYATLRPDSYSARGVVDLSVDQSQFEQFTAIYDAYRAVEALAADPRIDGARIALMGFSRGGTAALYASLARFHRAFGPRSGKIVAYLPFYPACNFELSGELEMSEAPIREFHGADDDWTPVAPCIAYFDRLEAAGVDASITIYPKALHAFDNLRNPARFTDADAQSSRNCLRREVDGVLVNAATGKPFTYVDDCVARGPSSQYNDKAATAAREAVKSFLAEVFAKR